MGVDLNVTVQIEDEDSLSQYRYDVLCNLWCGRWYHWAPYLGDDIDPRTFTFKYLHGFRDMPIHDGKVKDTNLYLIMRALAKKHGKRHVMALWRTE